METTSRFLIQQAIYAKLQISDSEFVQIERGVVIYVCFLKGCTKQIVSKAVHKLLNVELCICKERGKKVSVLELPGDVLIVPQSTLGGKMKKTVTQYHSNIPKNEGPELYEEFVRWTKLLVEEGNLTDANGQKHFVKYGTYGFREALDLKTNGPYFHMFEF